MTLSQLGPQLLLHLPILVFLFCFGACVGSFLNVVVYRLPEGMSVISPPSRCPTCGARLRFFRENLPILGWFLIRGRCRSCGVRVSPQYMIVELFVALMVVGLYAALYLSSARSGWWSQVGGPWWVYNGIARTWPAFIAFGCLFVSLAAMTLIDARTFTIPIQIPVVATLTAFVAWPLQTLLPRVATPSMTWPIPAAGWTAAGAAFGGMAGVLVGIALLRARRLRYSFHDYDDFVKEGETFGDYPHARREMLVEIAFLLPCIAGIVLGGVAGARIGEPPPVMVQALGGSMLGYLSGGALIWGTRILGTLGFGREAMGLGDVHLLAAVGAVLGWCDPILIFFLAPFSGLLWVLMSMGISSVFKTARRELPYGPHLAVATVLVFVGRPAIAGLLGVLMPGVEPCAPGLVP